MYRCSIRTSWKWKISSKKNSATSHYEKGKIGDEMFDKFSKSFIDTSVDVVTEIMQTDEKMLVKELMKRKSDSIYEKIRNKLQVLLSGYKDKKIEEIKKDSEKKVAEYDSNQNNIDLSIDIELLNIILNESGNNDSLQQSTIDTINNNYSSYDKFLKYNNHDNNFSKYASNQSFVVYKKYRADEVSQLLIFLAVFMKMNIFFETSSALGTYVDILLDDLNYALPEKEKYKIFLVYPYMTPIDETRDGVIERGIETGRFVPCESIKNKTALIEEEFNQIKSENKYTYYKYKSTKENVNSIKSENINVLDRIIRSEMLDTNIKIII